MTRSSKRLILKLQLEAASEKLALRVAQEAANRIFSPPKYERFTKGCFHTIYKGEDISGLLYPFPRDAVISRLISVRFVGSIGNFVIVELEGMPKKEKVQWSVKAVCAPFYPAIFTQEELEAFTRQV